MKNLKTILQSKYLYIFFFFFTFFYVLISFCQYQKPAIKKQKTCIGKVLSFKQTNNKITLEIKSNQKYLVNFYGDINFDIKLGDIVYLEGEYKIPKDNRNFNTFNYRKYLLSQKIQYLFYAEKIKKIKDNNNPFYTLKNKMIERIKPLKSNTYLYTFLLGDKSLMADEIKESYNQNGISHLFAVSGMHITLFTFLLLKIFPKKYNFYLCFFFLIFYMFLTNFTPSVLRSSFLFIILSIVNKANIKVSSLKCLTLILCLLLIYNPFYLYQIGFLFSFGITYTLIIFSKKIEDCSSFITKLIMTSFISFLASIPILLISYYEINILSFLLNLFFVPFVSYIVFPLSIITFIFPILDSFLYIILDIMEKISQDFNNYSIILIFGKWNFAIIFLYYLILYYSLKKNFYILIFIFLIICYYFPNIRKYPLVTMNDVGQGDSILIELPNNKNLLIDTGGMVSWDDNIYYVSKDTITYLKSKKIRKIDYLILTHGDYDHMGDAEYFINNFKVDYVFMNSGNKNELEQNLENLLLTKKISFKRINKYTLKIKEYIFQFINKQNKSNENEDSLIIYTKLNNKNILLMGDAEKDSEEYILNEYNLPKVDILKVGHHGSDTSSTEKFIKKISPKISLISVGENNRYGHPKMEIIKRLNMSNIYRTDKDGAILLRLEENINLKKCLS